MKAEHGGTLAGEGPESRGMQDPAFWTEELGFYLEGTREPGRL